MTTGRQAAEQAGGQNHDDGAGKRAAQLGLTATVASSCATSMFARECRKACCRCDRVRRLGGEGGGVLKRATM